MTSMLDEVKKLPVSDRTDLFLALKADVEMNQYLFNEKAEELLFAEISKRDNAYKNGQLHVTSIDDLKMKLQQRRDGL
ncbi:MAG: hypothetical protein ABIX01_09200 [Chitinophagaceae bacterium]